MTTTPAPGHDAYPPILSGLRVLDLSHQYSGALARVRSRSAAKWAATACSNTSASPFSSPSLASA